MRRWRIFSRRQAIACASGGGTLTPTELDPGADFVGVDVMPTPDGRLVVLELNGAVEFDDACAIGGVTVPERAATALRVALSPVLVG